MLFRKSSFKRLETPLFSIFFIIILSASVLSQSCPENLDEMCARKARMLSASWGPQYLENSSNHYIWQPETLMYYDSRTGHEVWRLSNTPGLSTFYHNDISQNVWSADGKRLAFSSQRPTSAFNNYDNWEGQYKRIWFIVNADGSDMRTPVNTPRRTAGGNPIFWSPQIPDTYYQMGDNHYLGSTGIPGTLYKVTVNDSSVSREPLLENLPIGNTAIYSSVVSISPDGKRVMVVDTAGGSEGYTSVAMIPATVYPKSEARIESPNGYPYFRNESMSEYSDTPSEYTKAHAGTYRLVGPHGERYLTVPSGSHCHWLFKTTGSAPDGGPLYTGDLIPPKDSPPYDFGEIEPLYGCEPNPFNAPYMSHGTFDQWGRLVLHSCCCVDECYQGPGVGPGVWDTVNHTFVVPTFGGGTQHHDWHGFTDWTVSTRGSGEDTGCIDLGYSDDPNYASDRIYTQKYDDPDSQQEVCYTHTLYNNNGCYNGATYEYTALPRPSQSPDGTKIAFHSTFLNPKTGEYDNSPDIYWAVAYYPYPPSNLTASYDNGILLTWKPPRYTQRGWPNETTDPPPYAREIRRYHIWRATSQNGPWNEIGYVNASYYVDDYYGLVPNLSALYFRDIPQDGTYYYGLTSEEHSGLESHELSEIVEATLSGTSLTTRIVQPRGQTNFWTQAPSSPSDFSYTPTGTPGHYLLSWKEPHDSKIRFYNIYYSNTSNPLPEQRYRIASLPAGTSSYLDWLADPDTQGYYGITSVDRQGNEGQIVYASSPETVIFEDDFSAWAEYNFSDDDWNPPGGWTYADSAPGSSSDTYNGETHYCAEVSYPGRLGSSDKSLKVWRHGSFFYNYCGSLQYMENISGNREIYNRWYMKIPENFSLSEGECNMNYLKLWRYIVANKSGCLLASWCPGAFEIYLNFNGPSFSKAMLQIGKSINPGAGWHTLVPVSEIRDGKWHSYELRIKLNDPGEANAEIDFWLDGKMRANFTGLDYGAVADMSFSKAALGIGNTGARDCNPQGEFQNQWLAIEFDDYVLSRQYIGPALSYHPADTNHNGKIELSELISFLRQWKSTGNVSIKEMIEVINMWKNV